MDMEIKLKRRIEQAKLEELAVKAVNNNESLGENEEVLAQSRLVDELILEEMKLKKQEKERI